MDSNDISLNFCNPKVKLSEISPKKSLADEAVISQPIADSDVLQVVKDRYRLTDEKCGITSHFKCLDLLTGEESLCRIAQEKYEKIVLAYFSLQQTDSEELDHQLVRPLLSAVPMDKNSTYLLIPPPIFGNLHTFVRDRKYIPELEAKTLFRQIVETVDLCHRSGIILRDLKLRKFFFIDSDRTKIQYESLEGCVVLDDPQDDRLVEKIGCPLYVAPEVITSCSTFRGKATDVWALGVILYTMLTGTYPFNEPNGATMFGKIINGVYHLPDILTPEAKCLIRCLLKKKPSDRPLVDEILYHPWFKQSKQIHLDDPNDQLVPDVLMYEEHMEFT